MNPIDLTIIESHNSTTHDSAVAVYHRGAVYALAAERVDRVKHSGDPTRAYERLWAELGPTTVRGAVRDHFEPGHRPFQSIDHHLAHAASAFYPSPFDEAAVLVLDGMGPYHSGLSASTSLWHGSATGLRRLEIVAQPGICYQSLGHFYAAVTYYLGFPFFDSSHTMSVAAYGNPHRYAAAVAKLLWPIPGGLFNTDEDFIFLPTFVRFGAAFGWRAAPTRIAALTRRYGELLGPMREPAERLSQRHFDIAAAAQRRLEEVFAHLLRRAHALTGSRNLC